MSVVARGAFARLIQERFYVDISEIALILYEQMKASGADIEVAALVELLAGLGFPVEAVTAALDFLGVHNVNESILAELVRLTG